MLKVSKTRKSACVLFMTVIMFLLSFAIPVIGAYETECDQYVLGETTQSKQYRYRVTLHQESTATSIEGWTKDENEIVTYGGWTNAGWTNTKPTESDTLQITDKKTEKQYRYKTYKSGSYYHFCPTQGKAENGVTYSKKYSSWSTTRYSGETHTQQHTTAGGATTSKACSSCGLKTGQHPKHYVIGDAHYYYEETRTVEKSWYYQKRTKTVSYNYNQVQLWSEWSFDEITSVDELNLGLSEGISATIETESRDVLTDKYGVCYSPDMTELYSVPKELSVNEFYVPDTVTRIGEKAFNGCTKIKKIILPSSVTSIGSKAFSGCTGLEEIVIPVEVTEIAEDAFEDCTGLKKILYTGSKEQWEKFDVILRPRFVSDVVIYFDYTYDILRIGHCGEEAIYKLYSDGTLVISGSGAMYDYGYNEETGEYTVPPYTDYYLDENGEIIGPDMFIKKAIVEDGITVIGSGAFSALQALTDVSLPDTLESINRTSFVVCTALKNIVIPDSVTFIGDEAFNECTALESIKLSAGLTSIEDYTFLLCENLKSIAIPESVQRIGNGAFILCNALERIEVYNKNCEFGNNVILTCEIDENGEPSLVDCVTTVVGYKGSTAKAYTVESTKNGYPIAFRLFEHDFIKSEVVAPDCTNEGYTIYKCSECGEEAFDDYINSLGHMEITDNYVAPSCTKTGLTEGSHCGRCGMVLKKQSTIPATGHTPSSKWIKSSTEHWKVCVTDYCGKEVPGTRASHSYKWETISEPTETKDGEKLGICDCGATTIEIIPVYGEGDVSNDKKCSHLCHKTGFLSFIWKIINFFCKLFRVNPVCDCGVAHY